MFSHVSKPPLFEEFQSKISEPAVDLDKLFSKKLNTLNVKQSSQNIKDENTYTISALFQEYDEGKLKINDLQLDINEAPG